MLILAYWPQVSSKYVFSFFCFFYKDLIIIVKINCILDAPFTDTWLQIKKKKSKQGELVCIIPTKEVSIASKFFQQNDNNKNKYMTDWNFMNYLLKKN